MHIFTYAHICLDIWIHICKWIYKVDSIYEGYTYLIMFGGRDNEGTATHIPRTYNVQEVDSTLSFTTYDQKPVNPCNDPQNNYYTQAQTSNCNFSTASIINVGVFYNDVWAYRICNSSGINQHRYADQACIGKFTIRCIHVLSCVHYLCFFVFYVGYVDEIDYETLFLIKHHHLHHVRVGLLCLYLLLFKCLLSLLMPYWLCIIRVFGR
jgi:hypothetical protein